MPNASEANSNPNPFLILLLLSIGSHFVFPIETIIYAPYTYFGIVLICLGIIIDLWSTLLFHRSKTTVSPRGSPTSLMTSGPYRISRNPMYLGMAAALLGVAILFGSLVTFAFPVIFVVTIEALFVSKEERTLERMFGEEYEDYKNKVRRWI